MMTGVTITELRHSGGYLVSEARGERSRDQVTLIQQAAQTTPPTNETPAGTILGVILDGTSATGAAQTVPAANTGNGTMSAITLAQGVVEGVYELTYLSATEFGVYSPAGDLVGEGKNGVAFAAGGLGFTMTAGGTAFVAGDGFTITLAANANVGLYNVLSLTAADGTQIPAGILFNTVDATGGNTAVTINSRACEVNGSELTYPSGATASQIATINAQLAQLGLIVR